MPYLLKENLEVFHSNDIGLLTLQTPQKFPYHLIILCTKGNLQANVGLHSFELSEQSLTIVPPQTLYKFTGRGVHVSFLAVKEDFLQRAFMRNEGLGELLFISPDYPPTFPLERNHFEDTLYKFQKIKEELDRESPFYLDIIRLYIVQILYEYNRACEYCLLHSNKMINRQYQVMHEYKKLVELHFKDVKNLKDYSEMMNLSPKYLSECVKSQTGKSAHKIIQERVVMEAEWLLKNKSLSIKDIAYQLGFRAPESFTRYFSKNTGIPPTLFSKNRKIDRSKGHPAMD